MLVSTWHNAQHEGSHRAGGQGGVDLLAGDVVVDGLDDPLEFIRHLSHLAGEIRDPVSEGLEVALELKLKVILIAHHGEQAQQETHQAKEAPESVEKPDTLLVSPVAGVEVQLDKLPRPPVNRMAESPLFCHQTEHLKEEEGKDEQKVGVGEESLASHVAPEVQQEPDAGAQGEGDVDLREEGRLARREVEALHADQDDQVQGDEAGAGGADHTRPELKRLDAELHQQHRPQVHGHRHHVTGEVDQLLEALQDVAEDGELLVGLTGPRPPVFFLVGAGGGGHQLLGGEDP